MGKVGKARGPHDSEHYTLYLANPEKSIGLTLHSTSEQLEEASKIVHRAILATFDPSDPTRLEPLWRTPTMDLDGADVLDWKTPAPASFEEAFRVLFLGQAPPQSYEPYKPLSLRKANFCRRFKMSMTYCLVESGFFTTESGTTGLGSLRIQIGDHILALLGLDLCLVLRPKGEKYQIVRDAYIYGIMHGEAFKLDDKENLIDLQEFLSVESQ